MKAKISSVVKNATIKNVTILSDKQIQGLDTLTGIALAIIAAGGILTLSAIAPNILSAAHSIFKSHPGGGCLTKKEKSAKISQTFYYLKRSGLIYLKPDLKDIKISLTNFGRKKYERISAEVTSIPSPSRWNGKWWQVAADIPTKQHRSGADSLRTKLKALGFYPLQRTLWFYPYDPRKQLGIIFKFYDIEHFVTLMEINRLDKEDEDKLKDFFQKRGIL